MFVTFLYIWILFYVAHARVLFLCSFVVACFDEFVPKPAGVVDRECNGSTNQLMSYGLYHTFKLYREKCTVVGWTDEWFGFIRKKYVIYVKKYNAQWGTSNICVCKLLKWYVSSWVYKALKCFNLNITFQLVYILMKQYSVATLIVLAGLTLNQRHYSNDCTLLQL